MQINARTVKIIGKSSLKCVPDRDKKESDEVRGDRHRMHDVPIPILGGYSAAGETLTTHPPVLGDPPALHFSHRHRLDPHRPMSRTAASPRLARRRWRVGTARAHPLPPL